MSDKAPYIPPAASGPRWRPDPRGLFGGQQVIGHRSGMYAQAAIDTSGNWNANSRRATEAEWLYTARAAAANPRLVWFNDMNDQSAANVPALGLVHATPSVLMAMVAPDGATVYPLDLRAIGTPHACLGNGVATPVTVNPRDGVVGVPGTPFPVARGDVIAGRIYVDRGNDTANVRFPIQGSQSAANDPGSEGASQNVVGPGTPHVHGTVAAWTALAYGALGFVMPLALIGDPIDGPMANVLILGDSIPNRSLDAATFPDFNIGFIKRAIHTMALGGMRITATALAQGNETLQNLVTTLQQPNNARRRILQAGCWTHVFISQARNDVQMARTAPQITGDYDTLFGIVDANTPDYTKIINDTMPPYTDGSNNRLNAAVVDAVLDYQLHTVPSRGVIVADTGAQFSSASDRNKWPMVNLGDSANLIQEGIHPGAPLHQKGADYLISRTDIWPIA